MRHSRVLLNLLVAVLLLGFAVVGCVTQEEADPLVIVFYEEGCPSCEAVEELLTALAPDLPPTAIRRYEISEPGAFELLTDLSDAHEIEVNTVPVVFVGDQAIVGSDRAAEFALRAAVGDCAFVGCPSPLELIRPPEFPWADVWTLAGLAAILVLLLVLQPV